MAGMESVSSDTTAKVDLRSVPSALAAPASSYAERVRAAGGVVLNLFGEIGPEAPLSLKSVKAQLGECSPHRIHFIIDSTGGNIVESKRIFNFLRNQPAKMSAEVGRYCLSAAVTILLAAAHRMAKIDSEILLHCARISATSITLQELKARDLRERAEMLERDDNAAIDMLAERTGYCRAWFERQFQNEDTLHVCEALESGLLHEVVGLSMRCDPRWIEQVRSTPRNVFWPQRYLTTNYFSACRAALRRSEDEN